MCIHQTTDCKICKQRPIEMNEEIHKFIVIIGNFNSPPLTIDRPTRQKISKNT